MNMLIIALAFLMGGVAGALTIANVYVVVATLLNKRRSAMRVLSHFSRAIMMLRLSDSISPSRLYR